MNKGLVTTSFVTKSGEGTPMFSNSGKRTVAQYICFKEAHHDTIAEVEEEVPEEVKKQQVKNDLKGEETNVFMDFKLKKHQEDTEREKEKARRYK